MFRDDDATRRRLARLEREWVRPARVLERARVEVTKWDVPDEPVPFGVATSHEFGVFAVGEPWSRPWGTSWFHLRGVVPQTWADRPQRTRHELVVDLGFSPVQPGFQAEGTVYRPDGSVVKGLEPLNCWVPIDAGPGETFEFYVEAASNPQVMKEDWTTPSELGLKETAGTDPIYRVRTIELQRVDTVVERFLAEVEVLDGWVDQLPSDSPRRAGILAALQDAVDELDPDNVAGTVEAARAALGPALASPAVASAGDVVAVGHAHIDSAWLWPIRETMRKVVRTFSNALELMEEDPDFVFAASSAQQYEWVRQTHPDVFERIRQRVAEGRWIIVGGQWVESDPYMIGGEAFIRQFSEAQSYFREHFGVEAKEVWLPDSFGYSANLPGIAAHVGIRWMLTQKLSWNDTNTFPHHTFWWEGLDGSRLFTHFPPVDTYNSMLTPEELHHSEVGFREGGAASMTLAPFGYGDGGGGPTREIIERAHLQADLEGSPRVRMASPETFFEEAEADYPQAPVWLGELYLENHRGVLTSQHRTKRGNRKSEHLLGEAELWAATAAVRLGVPYPHEELHELWRTVLLHQFHDILPGSSIAWVHREAEQTYAEVESRLEELIAGSLAALAGEGEQEMVANAGAFAVAGVPGGAVVPSVTGGAAAATVTGDEEGWIIDNDVIRLRIDLHGLVTSLVDLTRGREVVPAGQRLGELVLHRDIPTDWDAWNIDLDHFSHTRVIDSVEDIEVGTEEIDGSAWVRVSRSDGASRYVQTLRVGAGEPRVEFTTEVDWHERHKLLKLELPIAVHTDHAQSDIQFGHVDRPIHTNTSWDWARFETVGLRWVRVAEPDFGVAVANDQTYGHSFVREKGEDGVFVRIGESLLRAPMAPDPDADQGHHLLRTTVVVGAGVLDAVREGIRVNVPVRTLHGRREVSPLVVVGSGNALVDAVKIADDASGDLVVRLHETLGGRTEVLLHVDAPVSEARLTDGLERPLEEAAEVSVEEGTVSLSLSPFQVVTLRLVGRWSDPE